MSVAAAAALLMAGAVLVAGPRSGAGRLRELTGRRAAALGARTVSWPVRLGAAAAAAGLLGVAAGGPAAGLVLAGAAVAVLLAVRRSTQAAVRDDPAQLAGSWELLAVCLEAGLPVAVAVAAAAGRLTGPAAGRLRRIAGLLELGGDPGDAWAQAGETPALAAFARAARRSAATGAGIAQVARTEATRLRAELVDSARARAQRAGVHITGPLGLCFLPAFLVLGIAPVVIGLAGQALAQW